MSITILVAYLLAASFAAYLLGALDASLKSSEDVDMVLSCVGEISG